MKVSGGNSFSRRKFILQSGAFIGGSILLESFAGKAFSSLNKPAKFTFSNNIGEWFYTGNQLPAYQYKGELPFYGVDKKGIDSLLPDDPYFILGNYKCTLFAHASGIFQFLTGEREWARINAADQINYGANTARLSLVEKNGTSVFDLTGTKSLAADPAVTKRYFGTGFARYEYDLNKKIKCTRILSVKPSAKIHSGNPSVVITVSLTNNNAEKINVAYEEKIFMNYVLCNQQRKSKAKRAVTYTNKISVDAKEQTSLCKVSYVPNVFLTAHKEDENNLYDINPASVFMQVQKSAGADFIKCI